MASCVTCDRYFASRDDMLRHCRDKQDHPFCEQCERPFKDPKALHQHRRSLNDHWYCATCERVFVDEAAMTQHISKSKAHNTKGQDSDEDEAMDEDGSEDDDDSEDEDEDEKFCDSCDRDFANQYALNQHRAKSSKHHWCFECERDFDSEHNLRQHNASIVHNPRNLKCPLCDKEFKVPSAIMSHIERGCRSARRG